MLKRFDNNLKFLKWREQTFRVGEYVQSGRVKGTIVAIDGKKFDFLLDTDDIVSYKTIKHSEKPGTPAKPPSAAPRVRKVKSTDDCEKKIAKLERDLDECNSTRTLPPVVANAPAEVQEKLPEFRQEKIMQNIESATTDLVEAVEAGNRQEAVAAEKLIQKNVSELKEVAHQSTVSVTENCRVLMSKSNGRDTIRIYFNERPSRETITAIQKHNFRSYFDTVDKKREYYWGAYFTDERMKFAKNFCKSDVTPLSPPPPALELPDVIPSRPAEPSVINKPRDTPSWVQKAPKTPKIKPDPAPVVVPPIKSPETDNTDNELQELIAMMKSALAGNAEKKSTV